jgi:hypothetical protein
LIARLARVRTRPPQPMSKPVEVVGSDIKPTATSAPSDAPEDDRGHAFALCRSKPFCVAKIGHKGSVADPASRVGS